LRECHAEKSIAAGKIADAIIALVAIDALVEFVPGEKVHQLSEDERFGVHESFLSTLQWFQKDHVSPRF
jgi:hypothetical protein